MNKIIILSFLLIASIGLMAQDELTDEEAAALAKASQNPLAKMISVPFQNNTTYGIGPNNQAQNVLNIQPVYPIGLGNVNLINRLIAPVITQPNTATNDNTTGLGDISLTSWFSPSKASSITYGIGPALQFPTATSEEMGSGEFGIGPSVVALIMIKKWVAGIVTNNIWTFGDVEENKFLFQYFVNYNLPYGSYIVSAPIMTSNWNANSGDKWIVPLGGGLGKVFKLGKLPINFNAQAYYNAVSPSGWGKWQSRFQLQFMFPK